MVPFSLLFKLELCYVSPTAHVYNADEYNPDEDLGNMDHFEPDLRPGSDHESDDDLVTPPIYNSDEEQDKALTVLFFANVEKNRM